MFWESVLSGLEVLTYWEAYVAGLAYILLSLLPLLIFFVMMSTKPELFARLGCIWMILVRPFFYVSAIVIFVLIMFPILIGLNQDAAWLLPWALITESPGVFFKLCLAAFIATILLSFTPILGRIDPLYPMLIGTVTLVFLLKSLEKLDARFAIADVSFWPGFWFFVGIFVCGAAIAWIAVIMTAMVLSLLFRSTNESTGLLVAPIAAVFGFVPVFIYSAWIGQQIAY